MHFLYVGPSEWSSGPGEVLPWEVRDTRGLSPPAPPRNGLGHSSASSSPEALLDFSRDWAHRWTDSRVLEAFV